jgi:2-dehydro-3-deoxyphosphogluconate aldolase/(4S)-4-hydroxy-2-oxoglutarate aldolase
MILADVVPKMKWMPIIPADNPAQVVEDATSFRDAGFPVVEILCRTPAAIEAIRETVKKVDNLYIGAGTVLSLTMAEAAVKAGAKFLVSPAADPVMMDFAKEQNLQFVPGVCNPTDVAISLRHGHKLQKIYPAGPAGGVRYIEALWGPFGNEGVRFIAAEGINKQNYLDYLKHPMVVAVIGEWLPPLRGQALRDELVVVKKLLQAAA